MAFSNGFSGDYKALDVIVKTLHAKSYLVEGPIVNPALSVSSMGEVAYFYVDSAPTAAGSHNLGSQVTFTASGGKRIDVSLTTGYKIAAVIPHVNYATVSPDLIASKVAQESIKISNLRNEAFVTALLAGATAKEFTNAATAYTAILEGLKNFKVDNKSNAMRPTGGLISSAFLADLMVDNKFIRSTDRGDSLAYDGVQVMIQGIPFVECPDLTTASFILVNSEGIAAPVNINTLYVIDGTAAGYPGGTIISGEMGANFKVLVKADAPALDQSTGYFAAKYTEAAAE